MQHRAGDSIPEGEAPGSDFYTEFDTYDEWGFYGRYDEENYDVKSTSSGLSVSLINPDDIFFSYLRSWYFDVSISSSVEYVEGEANVITSLMCRSNTTGEYIFSINSLGNFLAIYYDVETGEYYEMDGGTIDEADFDKRSFEMTIDCIGENLDFYIDGELISSVVDNLLGGGIVGFSLESYDDLTANIIFNSMDIEVH